MVNESNSHHSGGWGGGDGRGRGGGRNNGGGGSTGDKAADARGEPCYICDSHEYFGISAQNCCASATRRRDTTYSLVRARRTR